MLGSYIDIWTESTRAWISCGPVTDIDTRRTIGVWVALRSRHLAVHRRSILRHP